MNPMDQILEREIAHLEQIVRMLTVTEHVDVNYWERRIEALKVRAAMPMHLERLELIAVQINRLRDGAGPSTGK
jgi:hypothetical protein